MGMPLGEVGVFDDERYQFSIFMTPVIYRVKGGFQPTVSQDRGSPKSRRRDSRRRGATKVIPEHITEFFRTLFKDRRFLCTESRNRFAGVLAPTSARDVASSPRSRLAKRASTM